MMRKIAFLAATVFVAVVPWSMAQKACSDYNTSTTFAPWDPSGLQGHSTGGHYFYTNSAATCSYGSIGGQYCASQCDAYGSAFGNDKGLLSNPLYSHTLGATVNGGTSGANGAAISCGATAAVTAVSCLIGTRPYARHGSRHW